jgi:uncharacterized protein (DUF2141 family)
LTALALAILLLLGLPGATALRAQERVVHAWQRQFYAPLDGKESLLFLERFERAKPALADMDGDGDRDLFVGAADGRVLYFENRGSKSAPVWRLANPAISAQGRTDAEGPGPIDVGGNAAPALVDIDGDGDLDLFVGAADGRVRFYRNEGNRFLPTFRLVTENFLGSSLGHNVVVSFADLNGDGLPDLSVGNEAGEVFIALNQGTRGQPRYCLETRSAPDCLAPLRKLVQLDPEDNAVPAWSDWDRDGDLDLFVGKSDGTIAYFQNIGTRRAGAWEPGERRFNILDSGGFAAPVFADLNGDGVDDLLLAGDGESLAFYTHRPKEQQFKLWIEDKNVLQVRRLAGYQSNLHVAAGDLTGNGLPDLVMGTRAGDLLVYLNVGSAKEPAFRSPEGPLLPTPQRAFAAPVLVDVDGDGDLDLIVGGREGRLEWIENTGNPRQPRWVTRSLFFGQVDVGSLSAPLFADLDGDGDLDLLVGNSVGSVVLYENTGSAKQPRYELRAANFGAIRVPNNAAPALFPWDAKGPPDLVLGNQSGSLVPAVRDPAVQVAESGAFSQERAWSGGLEAESYSAPHFADLDEDGRPDLLLGTGQGGLLVWRYEGNAPPTRIAAAGRRSNRLDEGGGQGAGPAAAGPLAAARELPLEPIFVYEPSSLEQLKVGRATKPVFFDANGDGRPDLVVGTAEGKLYLLENSGSRANPTWQVVTEALAGYDKGRNAAPAFADVDGDGDLDLAVGSEQGQVAYWENTGSARQPAFTPRDGMFALVRAGKNAVPAFVDVNGDGRPDLLVGNLKGEVQYYENLPGPRFELSIRRFVGLDVGVNASPSVAALLGPEQPFLIVGSDQGAMHIYAPTGTSRLRSSGWREVRRYLEGLKMPAGSRAAFADVDGDGDVDMVLGSDQGPLRLYRNQARGPESAPTAAQAPAPRR